VAESRKVVMDNPSVSFLERVVIVGAWGVLLLTIVTASGMLPTRSFASMATGFVMLGTSCVTFICVCWVSIRHLLTKRRSGRRFLAVLLAGILASLPIMVITVRLLAQ